MFLFVLGILFLFVLGILFLFVLGILFLFVLGILLAHLSRRLTGELIVYPCSGVRPSSSVVHNFKDLLL